MCLKYHGTEGCVCGGGGPIISILYQWKHTDSFVAVDGMRQYFFNEFSAGSSFSVSCWLHAAWFRDTQLISLMHSSFRGRRVAGSFEWGLRQITVARVRSARLFFTEKSSHGVKLTTRGTYAQAIRCTNTLFQDFSGSLKTIYFLHIIFEEVG